MDTLVNATIRTESIPTITITPEDSNNQKLSKLIKKANPNGTLKYSIIDLENITTLESPVWFRNLRSLMRQQSLILLGIKNPQLNLEICKALHIPIIEPVATHTHPQSDKQNLYIDKPIRSGQQAFSRLGSLIAGSHVSAGAEIAAAADIHVYGTCSGKIIAGVGGNKNARVYLQSGFPELLSIAGITLHSDDLNPIDRRCVFMIKNGQLVKVVL